MPLCSVCEKVTGTKCSVCKEVYFCDQTCQGESWKSHKPVCKKPVEPVKHTMGDLVTLIQRYGVDNPFENNHKLDSIMSLGNRVALFSRLVDATLSIISEEFIGLRMEDNPYLTIKNAALYDRINVSDEEMNTFMIPIVQKISKIAIDQEDDLLLETGRSLLQTIRQKFIIHACRYTLVYMFGWALADKRLFDTIRWRKREGSGFNMVVDFGCGSGYMASQIYHQCNIQVVAIDINPQAIQHFPVTNGGSKLLQNKRFSNALLLLCWPPHSTHSNDGVMAVEALRKFTGSKLLYIGEWKGGCTGTDEFFDELQKSWWRVKTVEIPIWYDMKDKAYFFERM